MPRNESNGIRFRVELPVHNFVGRLDELGSLKKALAKTLTTSATPTPYIVIVSGPTNKGKTQLVRQFIELNQRTYENIIWINSERRDTLEESFKTLAEDYLKISPTNANGSNTNFKFIVPHVVSKLSSSKTLFVYDSVDKLEIMKDVLEMKTSGEKLHVIITSRIEDLGEEFSVIRLDHYNSDDAEALRTLNYATERAAEKIMKIRNILVIIFIFAIGGVVAWYAVKYEIANEMTTTSTSTTTTSTTSTSTTTAPTTTTRKPTTTTRKPTTTTREPTTTSPTTQGPGVPCGPVFSCDASHNTPCTYECWHNTWEVRDRECRAMGSLNCCWSFDAPLYIGGGRCYCCERECNRF